MSDPWGMGNRTEADEKVASLLATAKASLGLSLTFLNRRAGTTQYLEVVESSIALGAAGLVPRTAGAGRGSAHRL